MKVKDISSILILKFRELIQLEVCSKRFEEELKKCEKEEKIEKAKLKK